MSRAKKDCFIVQRAAASGTGGAGAGRVVGGLGGRWCVVVARGWDWAWDWEVLALSLWAGPGPSRSRSASACVKELADANGNANENANGNANGNGTSTTIGVGGWAWAWACEHTGVGPGLGLGLGLGDLDLGTWGHGRGRRPRLDPARLDFFGFLLPPSSHSSPPPGPMFQFQFQGRGTWPGRGRAPTLYNRDTWRSRWRRGTLPSTAQDHISQMTAPPTQPARTCWAQHACLVLSPYHSCRIVRPLSGPRQAPACIHLLPTSGMRRTHPYAQQSAILSWLYPSSSSAQLSPSACASTRRLRWHGRRVPSADRAYRPRAMHASCHPSLLPHSLCLPVLGERRGGKSST